MSKQIHLISLYCTVCDLYATRLVTVAQRFSNNSCPKFTDEECLSIYLFGIIEQKFEVKAIHNFIKDYYGDWFPHLPNYHGFNKRVCRLHETFIELAGALLDRGDISHVHRDFLLDSMPVIVAAQSRSGRAKAASQLCDKGYCASKKMYFYGVKLHGLGQKVYARLPKPHLLEITPASVHDLTAAKEFLSDAHNMDIYCDKAFLDDEWDKELAERNVRVIAPPKSVKGQSLDAADRLFSSAVSRTRQAIESFFSWVQDKTRIQSASKIRSKNGLISFIFARLAAVCFLLNC